MNGNPRAVVPHTSSTNGGTADTKSYANQPVRYAWRIASSAFTSPKLVGWMTLVTKLSGTSRRNTVSTTRSALSSKRDACRLNAWVSGVMSST